MKITFTIPDEYGQLLTQATMKLGLSGVDDLMRVIVLESDEVFEAWKALGNYWLPNMEVAPSPDKDKWPNKYRQIPLKVTWKGRDRVQRMPVNSMRWVQDEDQAVDAK
jgi:hypothetical protein